jgi:hypothetical protein
VRKTVESSLPRLATKSGGRKRKKSLNDPRDLIVRGKTFHLGIDSKRKPQLTNGLPDGIFSYQKSQFGYILEGLWLKNIGFFSYHLKYFMGIRSFSGHLEYYIAIWYTLWPLVNLVVIWDLYLSTFWYIEPGKIWQPCFDSLPKEPKSLDGWLKFNTQRRFFATNRKNEWRHITHTDCKRAKSTSTIGLRLI